MEPLTLHDWTAAYALDALSEDETRDYEDHLATCDQCRAELGRLGGAVSALAFAVDSPVPPEALRARILEAARAERPNVVPLRPRWVRATAAIAAVAAIVAIGFGIWAASLSRSLDRERSARQTVERLFADPNAARKPVSGQAAGTLVVSPSGEAALIVSRLPAAPSGKTYEAWVIANGKPQRAGTFDGGGETSLLSLERKVPKGAKVAVTLERRPGTDQPTSQILLSTPTV
jgi:anti-sigma factor RsiW